MKDFLVKQHLVAVHALIEDVVELLLFVKVILLVSILLIESAPLAVLHKHVVVVGRIRFDWDHLHEILMWGKLTHDLELVLDGFLPGWALDFHGFDHEALLAILKRAGFIYCPEPSFTDHSINQNVILLSTVFGFYQFYLFLGLHNLL